MALRTIIEINTTTIRKTRVFGRNTIWKQFLLRLDKSTKTRLFITTMPS